MFTNKMLTTHGVLAAKNYSQRSILKQVYVKSETKLSLFS